MEVKFIYITTKQMAQIISASIDLSKVDKSKIINGKNGALFYNLDIVINNEPNQYGQTVKRYDN